MGHEFAQQREAEVPARPDEVWAAIATGPGIDSWFMGRSQVEAGPQGTVRTVFGDYAPRAADHRVGPGSPARLRQRAGAATAGSSRTSS